MMNQVTNKWMNEWMNETSLDAGDGLKQNKWN